MTIAGLKHPEGDYDLMTEKRSLGTQSEKNISNVSSNTNER
jgi:hypothetical protein